MDVYISHTRCAVDRVVIHVAEGRDIIFWARSVRSVIPGEKKMHVESDHTLILMVRIFSAEALSCTLSFPNAARYANVRLLLF